MWNPFRKKKDADSNRFADQAIYSHNWQERPLPDPGAQNYAWETLGLMAFTPVGPGVGLLGYITPLSGQLYYEQTIPLEGIPTTAGQIYSQPLLPAEKLNP